MLIKGLTGLIRLHSHGNLVDIDDRNLEKNLNDPTTRKTIHSQSILAQTFTDTKESAFDPEMSQYIGVPLRKVPAIESDKLEPLLCG